MRLILTLIITCIFGAAVVLAQDTPIIPDDTDTSGISDDDVNAVAHQLYCPVCENIPLDTCGTAACADWREEIRGMLATGVSEEDIIDNFVTRFGDRVVGTPRDPVIAAISIVTPWLAVLLGIAIGIYTILRWQRSVLENPNTVSEVTTDNQADTRSKYLEQLENDLAG